MGRSGPCRPLIAAIATVALACATAGCSSSTAGSAEEAATSGRQSRHNGVEATIPADWHRVRLAGLPGAEVPLEIASFKAVGAVGTICNPHRLVGQIPTGGALLQILQDSGVERHGAGAVSQAGDLSRYPLLPRPFHLGALQSFECGEAYNVFFRRGGRVFQLRVWAAPTGLSGTARDQIERLMDGLRVHRSQRLRVSYGPYLGVRCLRPSSSRCDKVGLDIVLRKKAVGVSASIAGRTIHLTTPGLHDGVRGKDWAGNLANAGLSRAAGPLHVPARNGKPWAGNPAVYVPIRVTATYADGRRVSGTFSHVQLAPGFG